MSDNRRPRPKRKRPAFFDSLRERDRLRAELQPDHPVTELTPEHIMLDLNVSRSWITRNGKKWPFAREYSRRMIRFEKRGYLKWKANRPRPFAGKLMDTA